MNKSKYMLRKAAGSYWLLDIGQSGLSFRKPIELNEVAAFIWQRDAKGISKEDIALELSKKYEIDISEALEDINVFLSQLQSL